MAALKQNKTTLLLSASYGVYSWANQLFFQLTQVSFINFLQYIYEYYRSLWATICKLKKISLILYSFSVLDKAQWAFEIKKLIILIYLLIWGSP